MELLELKLGFEVDLKVLQILWQSYFWPTLDLLKIRSDYFLRPEILDLEVNLATKECSTDFTLSIDCSLVIELPVFFVPGF